MPATPRRQQYVPVRLSASEHAKLVDLVAATRSTKSDVLRHLLAGQASLKPAPPARAAFDHKALAELARIGANVNQIARELHRHDRQVVTADEFQALDRALMQLAALVFMNPEKAEQLVGTGFSEFAPYLRIAPSTTRRP